MLSGSVAYWVTGDVATTIAIAVVVGLLSLPFAFLARELVFLTGTVSGDRAEKVYEWVQSVAGILNMGGVNLFYTVRERMGSLQVAGFGGIDQHEQARAIALLYKAAWLGYPIAEKGKQSILLAIPGLIMERLAMLVARERGKSLVKLRSISDVKLVYRLVKALASAHMGDRLLGAYTAYKILPRLLLEGLVRLEMDSRELELLESKLPFEPPWVKYRLREQLRRELDLLVKE